MAKIFDVNDWLKNHPNRNNFDLTHKVHGSYKFGVWYPFLCKPVVPTDSFKIDTAVSLRFMPMAFPTQSNMRAIFHYHYVRTKNIWKNFPNWLQGLEQHTPPYIDMPASYYKDGSLADYLGIQTSYHVNADKVRSNSLYRVVNLMKKVSIGVTPVFDQNSLCFDVQPYSDIEGHGRIVYKTFVELEDVNYPHVDGNFGVLYDFDIPYNTTKIDFGSNYLRALQDSSLTPYKAVVGFYNTSNLEVYGYKSIDPHVNQENFYFDECFVDLLFPDYWHTRYNSGINTNLDIRGFIILHYESLTPVALTSVVNGPMCYYEGYSKSVSDLGQSSPYFYSLYEQGSSDCVKVSALPFRAYESIMRCFYRNNQGVQPFRIGGQTVYNRWNTTLEDGADTTNYELFHRNWELDAYTSCLLSPQQDNSVFVGLTNVSALGNMRVSTPDGGEANIQLRDADDNSIEYENLRSDNPEARRFALNVASLGFTIPQFREANALQRFLELNIRKGYRYLDFIEGHFGKSPKYSELDMPEFLGGFTQRISVNEISNTNGASFNDNREINDTLGAIAGQARAIGGSTHGVTHYFDDFGFVIGVMCLVPDVAYDCLLPKHFNVKDPLDMYFPEFNNVGMLPVTHEELAPVQTIVDGHHLTDVFGYQRPNHDLVWYPDTVHGRFRDATGIGNSIICRRFATMPELNNSFLEIDSGSTDTIFNYTLGTDDICLGEIVLKISAKRPIPRLVVPSING